MSGGALARPVRVVLVDDLPASARPPLCGRPAADWLLDTVAAIGPDGLDVLGPDPAYLRDRVLARPDLAPLLGSGSVDSADPDGAERATGA
jgi:hypothetical protein